MAVGIFFDPNAAFYQRATAAEAEAVVAGGRLRNTWAFWRAVATLAEGLLERRVVPLMTDPDRSGPVEEEVVDTLAELRTRDVAGGSGLGSATLRRSLESDLMRYRSSDFFRLLCAGAHDLFEHGPGKDWDDERFEMVDSLVPGRNPVAGGASSAVRVVTWGSQTIPYKYWTRLTGNVRIFTLSFADPTNAELYEAGIADVGLLDTWFAGYDEEAPATQADIYVPWGGQMHFGYHWWMEKLMMADANAAARIFWPTLVDHYGGAEILNALAESVGWTTHDRISGGGYEEEGRAVNVLLAPVKRGFEPGAAFEAYAKAVREEAARAAQGGENSMDPMLARMTNYLDDPVPAAARYVAPYRPDIAFLQCANAVLGLCRATIAMDLPFVFEYTLQTTTKSQTFTVSLDGQVSAGAVTTSTTTSTVDRAQKRRSETVSPGGSFTLDFPAANYHIEIWGIEAVWALSLTEQDLPADGSDVVREFDLVAFFEDCVQKGYIPSVEAAVHVTASWERDGATVDLDEWFEENEDALEAMDGSVTFTGIVAQTANPVGYGVECWPASFLSSYVQSIAAVFAQRLDWFDSDAYGAEADRSTYRIAKVGMPAPSAAPRTVMAIAQAIAEKANNFSLGNIGPNGEDLGLQMPEWSADDVHSYQTGTRAPTSHADLRELLGLTGGAFRYYFSRADIVQDDPDVFAHKITFVRHGVETTVYEKDNPDYQDQYGAPLNFELDINLPADQFEFGVSGTGGESCRAFSTVGKAALRVLWNWQAVPAPS